MINTNTSIEDQVTVFFKGIAGVFFGLPHPMQWAIVGAGFVGFIIWKQGKNPSIEEIRKKLKKNKKRGRPNWHKLKNGKVACRHCYSPYRPTPQNTACPTCGRDPVAG